MKNLISNIKEVLESEAIPQFNALTELLFNYSCSVDDCFKATTITINKYNNNKINIYIFEFSFFLLEKLSSEDKEILKQNPIIQKKINSLLNGVAIELHQGLKDIYKDNIDIKLIERDDSTIVRFIYKSM